MEFDGPLLATQPEPEPLPYRFATPVDQFAAALQTPPEPALGPAPLPESIRPEVLRGERAQEYPPFGFEEAVEADVLFEWYRDPPLGFAGPSSVLPSEMQENSHFIPIEVTCPQFLVQGL